MMGRRKLKLMHKVSGSPVARKPTPKKRSAPPSTMLTSPISPSARRHKVRSRPIVFSDEETDGGNGSIVSEDDESDDAFESVRPPVPRQERRPVELGPPITTDDRMKDLPEIHKDTVHEFVAEAKKLEEKIRNRNGNQRRYFTETDFREMAISWTVTVEDMHAIPGIDQDNVNRYGSKFVPLVKQFQQTYDEMMDRNGHLDMDQNHRNVIDLCDSDVEYSDDGDDPHSSTAETSRHFDPPLPKSFEVAEFNKAMATAQQQPQLQQSKIEPPKPPSRGKFRGRVRSGSKRTRKASSSASGSGGPRARRGGFGGPSVARRASASRKTSVPSRISSTTSYKHNLMDSFGHGSGRGNGGGGGSGFSAMPT